MAMAFISTRNRRLEAMMEGSAVLIGRDGELFDKVMARHRIGPADMDKALRESDCDLADMRCAFLETDGSISIMTKKKS